MRESFANRLRRVREAAGFSQERAAVALRVSVRCYRSWEYRGPNAHLPDSDNRDKLLVLWPHLLTGEIPDRPAETIFIRA